MSDRVTASPAMWSYDLPWLDVATTTEDCCGCTWMVRRAVTFDIVLLDDDLLLLAGAAEDDLDVDMDGC